jgi:hypothetical protein
LWYWTSAASAEERLIEGWRYRRLDNVPRGTLSQVISEERAAMSEHPQGHHLVPKQVRARALGMSAPRSGASNAVGSEAQRVPGWSLVRFEARSFTARLLEHSRLTGTRESPTVPQALPQKHPIY